MDLLQSVDPTKSGAFSDPLRPSFYELAAQEQLQDLLKPCLRYILSVLAQRNPRYLLRTVNRFDEVYALLMWFIERHYLNTWGSSFAENFYGLRRRRRPGIATPRAKTASSARSTQQAMEALRPIDVQVSLFTLVALPYFQSKLHDLWEREGGGVDSEQGGLFGDDEEAAQSSTSRRAFVDEADQRESRLAQLQTLLRKSFKKGYPYVGTAWQLWLLSYNVRYLFDKTPFWRPWLRLMRMDVRRVGMNDYVSVTSTSTAPTATDPSSQPPSPPLIPPNLPSPVSRPVPFALGLLRSSPFIFFEALKYALPASIFFFKFLEWWYSPDNARRRRPGASGGVDKDGRAFNLNPPKILLPHLKGVLYNRPSNYKETPIPKTRLGLDDSENQEMIGLTHNGCPICGATPINNPTIFPTGYVCCYTCAFAYVEEFHRCPVTLKAVSHTSDLRRVLG